MAGVTVLKQPLDHAHGTWRANLRQAVRDPAQLLARLELPGGLPVDRAPAFPLRVPLSFVARMNKGDPADPLLRQVLPLVEENAEIPGFVADPVGDGQARRLPGMLRKYQGRALLMLTGVCAVHCRYCFRRHYPYGEDHGPNEQAVVDALRADPGLREVVLSGGDPLTLSDERLARWVARLAQVPQLRRLRVHSRVPVVLPERITDDLLAALCHSRLPVAMVLHINHPAEIDQALGAAVERLHGAGIWLFNQAVLLRGVNDQAEILRELSERLGECRIVPYYLHLLDRVAGAAHFAVGEERARALLEELRACLPGYLVPKLVKEVAGQAYKSPIC
jgi:EF-P beta-lysylation protein EpmB